ncbi:putative efflux pump antibiotic resistance protein [Roridomyces roridus]|uniref:Efflux pump antibiotic resistance protein n=1 Tax=Roridomyces roridus TaxID=1738132 RepID=A0AAD7FK20_9AGAR|nr:putative efflux pump antibiotic resistance protein [Roridomyces roridus]
MTMLSPVTPRRRTVYTPLAETWQPSEKAGFLATHAEEFSEEEEEYFDPRGSEEGNHLSGYKLVALMFALGLSVFLVALDNTIIDTAVPKITDEFGSLNDVGWYSSAYLLTTAGTQLLFGKFYTHFSVKRVYIISIILFELGSFVCGAAPSSSIFIIGRAIAGVGNAGIFSGGLVIIAHTVPLAKRPIFGGMLGGLGGIGSVTGPLLGGVITEKFSFRYCFYLSLPIGLLALVITQYFLNIRAPGLVKGESTAKLADFDPYGNLVFVPAMVMLLLAVQWGGTLLPWSSGLIITLLLASVILLVIFIYIQLWAGERATIPPRIIKQRTLWSSSLYAICIGGAFNIITMCLPIWFQVIHGDSPEDSGLDTLPVILALVGGAICAGALVGAIGYYTPFMLLSSVCVVMGSGLLSSLTVSATPANWLLGEILCGFGVGLGLQEPVLAAQTVLELKDVPVGTALVMFANTLGGALFVAIAQSVFTSSLVAGLVATVPGVSPKIVLSDGANSLKEVIAPEYLPAVLAEYNHAIMMSFYVALALGIVAFAGSCAVEWRSVKEKRGEMEMTFVA